MSILFPKMYAFMYPPKFHLAENINNEMTIDETVILGQDANSSNQVESGSVCIDVSFEEDDIKEDDEIFALLMDSDDPCVCLGRDIADIRVLANGGIQTFIKIKRSKNITVGN